MKTEIMISSIVLVVFVVVSILIYWSKRKIEPHAYVYKNDFPTNIKPEPKYLTEEQHHDIHTAWGDMGYYPHRRNEYEYDGATTETSTTNMQNNTGYVSDSVSVSTENATNTEDDVMDNTSTSNMYFGNQTVMKCKDKPGTFWCATLEECLPVDKPCKTQVDETTTDTQQYDCPRDINGNCINNYEDQISEAEKKRREEAAAKAQEEAEEKQKRREDAEKKRREEAEAAAKAQEEAEAAKAQEEAEEKQKRREDAEKKRREEAEAAAKAQEEAEKKQKRREYAEKKRREEVRSKLKKATQGANVTFLESAIDEANSLDIDTSDAKTRLHTLKTWYGDAGCHNNRQLSVNTCNKTKLCRTVGQQRNGCWHMRAREFTDEDKKYYSKGYVDVVEENMK
jgi:chemotaxis protein histidine kinase CheA